MLVSDAGAGAAQPADHLADMQQDTVFAADLLQAGPVARGWNDGAGGLGCLTRDDLLDGVGSATTVILDVPSPAAFQAIRDYYEASGIWAVLFGLLRLTRCRQGAGDGAVMTALAVEDLPLAPSTMPRRDLADHLADLCVHLEPRVQMMLVRP